MKKGCDAVWSGCMFNSEETAASRCHIPALFRDKELFCPADEGSRFLRNVRTCQQTKHSTSQTALLTLNFSFVSDYITLRSLM
jgi:hypothetical protein